MGIFDVLKKVGQLPAAIGKPFFQKVPSVAGVVGRAVATGLAFIPGAAGTGLAAVKKVPAIAKGLFIGKTLGTTVLKTGSTVAAAGLGAGLGVKGTKKVAKKVFDVGKTGGQIIAGKEPIPPDVATGLKTAGLIGAGAALTGGGIVAAKKIKEKLTSKPSEQLGGVPNVPVLTPAVESPLGAAQPTPEKPTEALQSPITVNPKITVKPNFFNTVQIQNVR